MLDGEAAFEVERIIGKRRVVSTGAGAGSGASVSSTSRCGPPRVDPDAWLFKVKWRGFADKDCTWEPYAHVAQCTDLMEEFFEEDDKATAEKKRKRKEAAAKAKEAAAAAAAAAAGVGGLERAESAAAAVTPSRSASAARLSIGAPPPVPTFPADLGECSLCRQALPSPSSASSSSAAPHDAVFCKSCFTPVHRQCSEQAGVSGQGVWSCPSCLMAEAMESAPASRSSSNAAASAAASSSEPASSSDHLRTLLLQVQAEVTRDNWQSVPIVASRGAAASTLSWQNLVDLFKLCDHSSSARAGLFELVSVDVYEHLLSQLLMPCLQSGLDQRLVTGDGVLPSAISREQTLKAVNACSIALIVMSVPNVHRRLIQEQHVRLVVEFILHAIRNVILPLYDSAAREKFTTVGTNQQEAKKDKKKKKAAEKKVKSEEGSDEDMEDEEEEKKGAAASSTADNSYWSSLQQQLRYLPNAVAALFSLLIRFRSLERFPDLLASKVLDTCFLLFGVTPVTPSSDISCLLHLQSTATQWVQSSFSNGDNAVKHGIMESIATTYRNLNPSRRHLRTYVVHQGRQKLKKEAAASAAAAAAASSSTAAAAAAASTAAGAATAESLLTAIGTSVPLPSAADLKEQPQVSIQLLTALVCQLLQSLAAQPLQAGSSAAGGEAGSLLERIQREVREKDLAQAAATLAAEEEAASGKKGSKKKKKRKGSADATADEEMKDVAAEAAAIAAAAAAADVSPFTALHSALDTPQVRAEFINTVTAPVASVHECSAFFLRRLFEAIQPPSKDAPSASNALNRPTSRLLLRNFVEDILQLLFSPEFPIAEHMLMSIVKMLVVTVDSQNTVVHARSRQSSACERTALTSFSATLCVSVSVSVCRQGKQVERWFPTDQFASAESHHDPSEAALAHRNGIADSLPTAQEARR